MGTPMDASYTHLFMEMFETSVLYVFHKKIWNEILNMATFYR